MAAITAHAGSRFTIGGPGGKYNPINQYGPGTEILFYGGVVVDAIQIGAQSAEEVWELGG